MSRQRIRAGFIGLNLPIDPRPRMNSSCEDVNEAELVKLRFFTGIDPPDGRGFERISDRL
jgi:hypothetical protein